MSNLKNRKPYRIDILHKICAGIYVVRESLHIRSSVGPKLAFACEKTMNETILLPVYNEPRIGDYVAVWNTCIEKWARGKILSDQLQLQQPKGEQYEIYLIDQGHIIKSNSKHLKKLPEEYLPKKLKPQAAVIGLYGIIPVYERFNYIDGNKFLSKVDKWLPVAENIIEDILKRCTTISFRPIQKIHRITFGDVLVQFDPDGPKISLQEILCRITCAMKSEPFATDIKHSLLKYERDFKSYIIDETEFISSSDDDDDDDNSENVLESEVPLNEYEDSIVKVNTHRKVKNSSKTDGQFHSVSMTDNDGKSDDFCSNRTRDQMSDSTDYLDKSSEFNPSSSMTLNGYENQKGAVLKKYKSNENDKHEQVKAILMPAVDAYSPATGWKNIDDDKKVDSKGCQQQDQITCKNLHINTVEEDEMVNRLTLHDTNNNSRAKSVSRVTSYIYDSYEEMLAQNSAKSGMKNVQKP